MRRSRIATALLCLLSVVLLAAGCGSSSKKAQPAAAEAKSAATGDIPDSQVFLRFKNAAAGYSILYPEGWARKGSGNDVTFQDKDNVIHIVVRPGNGTSRGKRTSSALSPPNPVTGKRLKLMIDRYEYAGKGRHATLDLTTPVGVDNVDAYKMISRSFKWQ
jgi:hypothetical protein